MRNHEHLHIQATEVFSISDILRDLKKFIAKAMVRKLEDEKPGRF
jgi:putative transposase